MKSIFHHPDNRNIAQQCATFSQSYKITWQLQRRIYIPTLVIWGCRGREKLDPLQNTVQVFPREKSLGYLSLSLTACQFDWFECFRKSLPGNLLSKWTIGFPWIWTSEFVLHCSVLYLSEFVLFNSSWNSNWLLRPQHQESQLWIIRNDLAYNSDDARKQGKHLDFMVLCLIVFLYLCFLSGNFCICLY